MVVFTEEDSLPYDRPKLSKSMTATAQELALRQDEFYAEAQIEVLTGHRVAGVDAAKKLIHFEGERAPFTYDQLVVASGSTPRKLDVENAGLDRIMTLRMPADANAIANRAAGADVVIVGSSFIGMEVAAFAVAKARSVTVVGTSSVPFQRSLGSEIGAFFKELHEKKGVHFETGTSVERFEASEEDGGAVGSVVLKNGKTLPAQLVVLGIGVTPNTDFLRDSGVPLTERGFVPVDAHMRCQAADVDGVFAVGDVAAFPLACAGGASVSIGHWQLAHAHGRAAALNLRAADRPINSVPFFWTMQYGKSLRYAGYATSVDDVVYDGSVSEGEFAAYFCEDGVVRAVATLMRDPVAADFANLTRAGKVLRKEDVKTQWNKANL